MKRYIMLAGFGVALAGGPAAAMTDAECAAGWTRVNTNNDATLTEAEGSAFFAALRTANKPMADGRMTRAQFMEHCKADLFVTAMAAPATGMAGGINVAPASGTAMPAPSPGVASTTVPPTAMPSTMSSASAPPMTTGTAASKPMSEAECVTAWQKADANNDGTVTEAESARYFAALRVANRPAPDGKITRAQFIENCKNNMFVSASIDPGAPLSGANSFTEGQAKDRILAAGLMNVSGLQKDSNGVWRGTASDGTKTLNVAVDYKGNVVSR